MSKTRTIIGSIGIALFIISAGCSTFVGGSGPAEETTALTQTPEPTPEVTDTPTPLASETENTPVATEEPETETESNNEEELSKAEKFKQFDENMQALYDLDDENRSAETDVFPQNDSYHITVEMRATTNTTKTQQDRLDPLWKYYAIVEDYNNNDDHLPERDHTYIPDTVNVTFVTEDGGVFETTYIKYNWAYKYYTDEWSLRVFMGTYGSTTKEGPAYHENGR